MFSASFFLELALRARVVYFSRDGRNGNTGLRVLALRRDMERAVNVCDIRTMGNNGWRMK